ncbi:uncharacterized protein [Narcine bancroftii]
MFIKGWKLLLLQCAFPTTWRLFLRNGIRGRLARMTIRGQRRRGTAVLESWWNAGRPQKSDRAGNKWPRALPACGFASTGTADLKPWSVQKGATTSTGGRITTSRAHDHHICAEFMTMPEPGKAYTATVTPPAAVSPVPWRPVATAGIPPSLLQMSQSQRLSQQAQVPRILLQQIQAPQKLYQQLPVLQGPPFLHLRDQRLRLSHVLRPVRLELNPRNPGAGTHFGRWQRCFLNYVEGAEASDKELLLAQLGDHPYSLIQDAKSYQEAMSILQSHYNKGHSELHSRYRLMTRSQQVGESARDFILSLKDLSRGGNFKAVSAQEYVEDLIRDRIVAGIQSTETRHQLLEKGMVGLKEAKTIAEALKSTRKSLEEYSRTLGLRQMSHCWTL